MKFKIGDRVKIIDCKEGHEFNIGEIVKILTIFDNSYEAQSKDGSIWWIGDDEAESLNENSQEIHITVKNTTIHAIMKENGKTVKHVNAKLHPDDEFDFETGVNLCIDRLFDRDKRHIDIKEVERTAEIGEYVKIIESSSTIPETNGVPDYKVGDILKIKSIDCWGDVSYTEEDKIEYADDKTLRLLNSWEYVVLENYKESQLDLSSIPTDDLLQEIHRRVIK